MTDAYHLGEPDDPGHQTHLFLDDFSIEDRWDAERVQNEPVKHPRNPVVLADLPWEVTVNAPSVLYDDEAGLFRMWYSLPSNAAWTRESTGLARKPREYGPYVMSYAESEDGVTWHKPLFDRFPFAEWRPDQHRLHRGRRRQGTGRRLRRQGEPGAAGGARPLHVQLQGRQVRLAASSRKT